MTELLQHPAMFATAILAVMIVGIGKGGFAGGTVLIGVPLMSLATDPARAAAILLPLLLLMDAFAVRAWWKKWDLAELRVLLPGALIGTLLGWITFEFLSADGLRVLVGLLATAYSLLWFVTRNGKRVARTPNRLKGVFWGSAAGFTSFAVHAGSPPLHVYLLGQNLGKSSFQATTVLFFFVVNWLKLGPYAMLGQLDASNLSVSLILLPLAPLAVVTGAWLHNKVAELTFFKLTYSALLVIGLRLIWQGLS